MNFFRLHVDRQNFVSAEIPDTGQPDCHIRLILAKMTMHQGIGAQLLDQSYRELAITVAAIDQIEIFRRGE